MSNALDALRRLAEVLLALLQAESTLHRKIALHLPREATLESKTRTVTQVFHDAELTSQDVTDVLLPLLPDGKLEGTDEEPREKCGADRLDGAQSSGPVGRRGVQDLPSAPERAIPTRRHVSFPKCQVLS